MSKFRSAFQPRVRVGSRAIGTYDCTMNELNDGNEQEAWGPEILREVGKRQRGRGLEECGAGLWPKHYLHKARQHRGQSEDDPYRTEAKRG